MIQHSSNTKAERYQPESYLTAQANAMSVLWLHGVALFLTGLESAYEELGDACCFTASFSMI